MRGWSYADRYSAFRGHRFGSDPTGLRADRFVVCSQNHDQVGNRARGDRLAALTGPGGPEVAAAAVLLSPFVPLLFMGEEYGDPAPFPYFVSHSDPALVEAVRAGRAAEFADLVGVDTPDPQDEATFASAVLDRSLAAPGATPAAARLVPDAPRLPGRPPDPAGSRPHDRACRRAGRAVIVHHVQDGMQTPLLVLHFGREDADLALAARGLCVLLDSGAAQFAGTGAARIDGAALTVHGRQAVVLGHAPEPAP